MITKLFIVNYGDREKSTTINQVVAFTDPAGHTD